jgi:hypothetical protein
MNSRLKAINNRIGKTTGIDTVTMITKAIIDDTAVWQYKEMQDRQTKGYPITGDYSKNWEDMTIEEQREKAGISIGFMTFNNKEELEEWKTNTKWDEWLDEQGTQIKYLKSKFS